MARGKRYGAPVVDTAKAAAVPHASLPGQLLSPTPLLSEYVSLLSDPHGSAGGEPQSREQRMGERDFVR